jgi:hypothetical protein
MTEYTKDPDAVLNYLFDWSEWLAAGETIQSYVLTVATGLTLDTDSNTTTTVTAKLSGGTAGESYSVACRISTNASQTDERTITINVAER